MPSIYFLINNINNQTLGRSRRWGSGGIFEWLPATSTDFSPPYQTTVTQGGVWRVEIDNPLVDWFEVFIW